MRSATGYAITAAAILGVTALGGCASSWRPTSPMATTESPNPIQVTVSRLRHVTPTPNGRLRASDAADLANFIRASDAHPGERVSVLRGSSGADVVGADLVAAELARLGLAPVVVAAPERASGSVEVVVERYVAAAPDCPNWTKPAGGDPYNHMPSDFGCAVQNDLAAMVVDPHDLIAGREPGLLAGDAAARPVARYRAGLVPPLGATAPAGATPTAAPAAGGGGAPASQ